MRAIKADSFSADLELRASSLVVLLRGNADMSVHDTFKSFLDEVQQAARKAKATEAVFDVGELYFMSSSCLSLVLRFLNAIVELRPSERFTVRFRSNHNLRWQAKSLAALQSYAPDIVVIE